MATNTNPESVAQQAPPATVTRPDLGTMLVLLTGTFMAVLDFFIVNVAIPSIQQDLGASAAAIQFIVAGFALSYGSALIIGGRFGDIFGRRRMFVLGMVLFTLTSAACGIAPNTAVLVTSRVLQGLAAALLAPQVLTILGHTYQGEARARAFNAYGVTMGLAAVFGQLIGGLLIKGDVFGLGWRACFLINVPVGVAALVMVPRFVPESRAPGRPRVDYVGMVLIALALVAVALPLIEGREQGWPAWSWVCLAAAVPLFALFGFYEGRTGAKGGSPLVSLGLFHERAFTAGLAAQLVFWSGQAAFFLVFAVYVQSGRGLDALQAGLIFVAIGTGYMATSTTARHVAAKLGRQVIALGGLLRALGLTLLIVTTLLIGTHGSVAWWIPALIVDGAGMGLAVAPLASTVLSRVNPQHAGAASGVLTTGIQVGNAFGVAIIGIIFYGVLGTHPTADRFMHAFNYSLLYLVGVVLSLALIVQFLPRRPEAH